MLMDPQLHRERRIFGEMLHFLRGVNDLRTSPPVLEVSDYQWFMLEADLDPVIRGPGLVELGVDEEFLSVPDLELPRPPRVPSSLVSALASGSSPERGEMPRVDSSKPRASDLREWIEREWIAWQNEYRITEEVMVLYRGLFDIRQRLMVESEAVELRLGLGIFQWAGLDGRRIRHPLVSTEASIERDEFGTIRVVLENSWQAERRVFPAPMLADPDQFARWSEDMPDDRDWTEIRSDPAKFREAIRNLARSISLDAIEETGERWISKDPTYTFEWCLYLRSREVAYPRFLELLGEIDPDAGRFSAPLRALIKTPGSNVGDQDGGSSDLLYTPLPTNAEQARILRQLNSSTGVVVQGPPGTGKSHTIANVISHSLATGRRVLVLAEKEAALKVLAEKVPPTVRSLLVPVLGSPAEGNRALQRSLTAIVDRLAALDDDESSRVISELEQRLEAVEGELALLEGQLAKVRRAEVEVIDGVWECGERPTASKLAAWLADTPHLGEIVPDRVDTEMSCPLTEEEFDELNTLMSSLDEQDVVETSKELPPPDQLPHSSELRDLFKRRVELGAIIQSCVPYIVNWSSIDNDFTGEQLMDLHRRFVEEAEWLLRSSDTWMRGVSDQMTDMTLRDRWVSLLRECDEDRMKIVELGTKLDTHEFSVIPQINDLRTLLSQFIRLTENDLDRRQLKKVTRKLKHLSVDGKGALTVADARLWLDHLERRRLRQEFTRRWNTRMREVNGPEILSDQPEIMVRDALADLRRAVDARTRWSELRKSALETGVSVNVDPDVVALNDYVDLFLKACRRPEEREVVRRIDELEKTLGACTRTLDAASVAVSLQQALLAQNLDAWEQARAELRRLIALRPLAQRREMLLTRLAMSAPGWSERIRSREYPSVSGSDCLKAWEWRLGSAHLNEIWSLGDPQRIHQTIVGCRAKRLEILGDLVDRRSWLLTKRSMSVGNRRSLETFASALRELGRGTGKYALRKEANLRTAMQDAATAVPVWIMTRSRAYQAFKPSVEPQFDLMIIDEASQIGVEGLALFSLAKQVLVVGDDLQTTPVEILNQQHNVYHQLVEAHLSEIPNSRVLFNPGCHIYGIAKIIFANVVMLREHFRCLPQIIAFSNRHIYENAIQPLRDQSPRPNWKQVEARFVPDGVRRGDANPREATAVVDLLEELLANPDYEGMSFGVVTLLGKDQMKIIYDEIVRRIGVTRFENLRMRVSDPAGFQGDERDVMIASLVVGYQPESESIIVGAMTDENSRRRINVAASRARNQMWVVHSVMPDQFPKGDLRAELIQHCLDPLGSSAEIESLTSSVESPFELEVARRLMAKGFSRIRPQYPSGGFRIDLVVEGEDSRLAIECDGDRWHGPERWEQDRSRQEVLERAGWKFVRIRGSAFFRDPIEAMKPVWAALDDMGIEPDSFTVDDEDVDKV